MLKTYIIGISLSVFSAVLFFFFFSSKNNDSLNLLDGLWIESSRDVNFSSLTKEPFYLEKVPNKDLLIFSQLKKTNKNSNANRSSTFPITSSKDNKGFAAVSLDPAYPCKILGNMENDRLVTKIQCLEEEDQSLKTGTIVFTKTNSSLFQAIGKKQNDEAEIQTLLSISNLERYNKEIHTLKQKLKQISDTLGEDSLIEEIKKGLNKNHNVALDNNSAKEQAEKLKQLKKSYEELEGYRKAQLKVSTYGSEIELASRINNLEWQKAVKNWNQSRPDLNTLPATNEANKNSSIENANPTPSQNMIDTPRNNQTQEGDNNGSWWKDF